MNVRLTPHHHPRRSELYGGVGRVVSDGQWLRLHARGAGPSAPTVDIPLAYVAEIVLDGDGAVS